MDKSLAAQMLKAARSLDHHLGAVDDVVTLIEDEREKQEYMAALGEVMDLIARKFIFRIFREHPELDDEK